MKVNKHKEDVKLQCVGVQQTRGAKKNVCVRDEQQNCEVPKIGERARESFSPTIVKSNAVGGVCMWVRTDSPATPLPRP